MSRGTVSNLIETFTADKPRHRDIYKNWVVDDFNGLIALFSQAVTFDFGSTVPTQEQISFGLSLIRQDMFKLPFPVTAFKCIDSADNHGLAIAWVDQDECLQIIITIQANNGENKTRPFVFMTKLDSKDGDGEYHIMFQEKWMRPGHKEKLSTALIDSAMDIVGYVVMLMAKNGVERIYHPAPEKLNKRRAKKGKPPIGDTYVVKLTAHPVSEEGRGGTHASPRPHWRRGHYRRLDGGTRVVPVAPSLVNADIFDGSPPKEYKVVE